MMHHLMKHVMTPQTKYTINYSSKDANHMTVHVEYVGELGIDRYYVASSHIANHKLL